MILCDTNMLIHAFNGHAPTLEVLEKLGFEKMVRSSITVMELFQGMSNKRELGQMRSRIRFFDILTLNHRSASLAMNMGGGVCT